MDPKLAILFLLIGAVTTLSAFADGTFDKVREQIRGARRR